MSCASGHNGPTFFNLRTCRCEQDDDVECYDDSNEEHREGESMQYSAKINLNKLNCLKTNG